MEIKYYGNASFHIKGKKVSVALNPVEGNSKADVVLLSNSDKETVGNVVTWPGEYEVSEVCVMGFEVPFGNATTILYSFTLDEVRFLYLPNLDHVPSEEVMEKCIGADVVFIPVGGNGALDAKLASQINEEIDPKVVIPMQFGAQGDEPVANFLKEIGKVGVMPIPSLVIDKSKLPMDSTEVYLLEEQS